jgi:hypothetical protein
VELDAPAVELDLVNPLGTGRRDFRQRRAIGLMKGILRNMPPMWEGAPVYTTQPFLRLGETRPLSRQTAEIDGLVLEGLTYVSRKRAVDHR